MFQSPVKILSRTCQSVQFNPRLIKQFSRFQSTIAQTPKPQKPRGFKDLMKEYGFAGLAVYFGLSILDLPFFYLLVHSMGSEKIEYYENKAKQQFGYGITDEELKERQEISKIHQRVEESESNNELTKPDTSWLEFFKSQFSLTELILAYGVHKSFIFIRLPIAAAITPYIVKTLRRWGFKIGSQSLSTTAEIVKSASSKANAKKRWFSWFF